MTIRVLLKQLHMLAGEMGADTEVRMHVTGKSSVITEVARIEYVRGSIALIKGRKTKEKAKDEDSRILQRQRSRSFRNRCRQRGQCQRCGGPIDGDRKTQCKACGEFRQAKAKQAVKAA